MGLAYVHDLGTASSAVEGRNGRLGERPYAEACASCGSTAGAFTSGVRLGAGSRLTTPTVRMTPSHCVQRSVASNATYPTTTAVTGYASSAIDASIAGVRCKPM